nr:hypothetical protein [Tanacetum cinerariifolium]
MTLELANCAICTPDRIARDVFVLVGRPFLRTYRALIDVHGEERFSVTEIKDCLKDLVSHKHSGNPTFSLHKEIASLEVIPEFHDSKGCTFLSEELPDIDSFNDIHPHFDDDPLSGSTTYSANSLLEEFADELALISYPPDYDDNRACDIESDIRVIDFLLYQGEDSDFKDSIDQSVLTHYDDLFVDPTPEMFIDEQPPDYSFPPRFDVYPDDFLEIEEIEFLLFQGEDSDFKDLIDQSVRTHYDDLFVDLTPEMFAEEQPPDYSFPLRFDVYPDDFLEIESDATFDDDSFDSEGSRKLLFYGDPSREVPVNETFHVQTDDELTEKELKQIEADD